MPNILLDCISAYCTHELSKIVYNDNNIREFLVLYQYLIYKSIHLMFIPIVINIMRTTNEITISIDNSVHEVLAWYYNNY